MDEVRKALTKQEQVLLSDLWENKDVMHALTKALLQRQFNLAIDTMANAPDWDNVLKQRGEVNGCKWVINFLKLNFKETRKSANQDNTKSE